MGIMCRKAVKRQNLRGLREGKNPSALPPSLRVLLPVCGESAARSLHAGISIEGVSKGAVSAPEAPSPQS